MGFAAHRILVACLCAVLFSSVVNARGEENPLNPWSMSDDVPAVTALPDETIGKDFCFMLLRFYQKVLSVVTVSHCPMLPSCSNYSIEAIRKDGPIMGILLTADRLLHEGDERFYAEEVRQDGKLKYVDTVENNDFWWHEK